MTPPFVRFIGAESGKPIHIDAFLIESVGASPREPHATVVRYGDGGAATHALISEDPDTAMELISLVLNACTCQEGQA